MGADFAAASVAAAHVAQRLGWTPAAFWAATPADLRLALGPVSDAQAIDATTFAVLQKAFPDG